MAIGEGKKVNIVEYFTMKDMVKELVHKGVITQEIMDMTMERIAEENGLTDVVCPPINSQRDKNGSVRTITIQPANTQPETPRSHAPKENDILVVSNLSMTECISLTEIVRSHHIENPSYVIQSWMRSENTLAFLDLWEQENNPAYNASAYAMLRERKKSTSFTVTVKQWTEQTRAIGITSKQGKQGGTFAHPIIAYEFATWLSPKYMMKMLKMVQFGEDFFKLGT